MINTPVHNFVNMITINGTYFENGKTTIKPIHIKTQWSEVTFKEYCRLCDNNDPDPAKRLIVQLSILSGLKIKEIKSFNEDTIARIAGMILFSRNTDEVEQSVNIPKELKGFNIGLRPYGDILKIKRKYNELVKAKKNRIHLGKLLCKLFLNEDVDDKPILEVIGKTNFFLACFLSSLTPTKG